MSFNNFQLSPAILAALKQRGYDTPTTVQVKAIPQIMTGKDVLVAAQTGTGKTASFILPLLEALSTLSPVKSNQVQSLVLTPTRELAAQVAASATLYASNLPLRIEAVFGGVKINPQMMRLRKGTDILVATPGRLLDLYNQHAIKFDQLRFLVLDEADRMLDMGFISDIRKIIALLPVHRQNLMFSATFSDEIRQLSKQLFNKPIEITINPKVTTATTVQQWVYPVDKKKKAILLIKLIHKNQWNQLLIFTKTKKGADNLTRLLNSEGIKAGAIHSDKSQAIRMKMLDAFKDHSLTALIATDVAARGIDIHQLPQVVNFDLPIIPEDYIHRIGRTGRAGAKGKALSLVCADEFRQLTAIEYLIKQLLPRKLVDGFEPKHNVPESILNLRLKKPKKPKKPKVHKNPTTEASSKTAAILSAPRQTKSNVSGQKSKHKIPTKAQKYSSKK